MSGRGFKESQIEKDIEEDGMEDLAEGKNKAPQGYLDIVRKHTPIDYTPHRMAYLAGERK